MRKTPLFCVLPFSPGSSSKEICTAPGELLKHENKGQVGWYAPLIPLLWGQREAISQSSSQGHIVGPYLQKRQKQWKENKVDFKNSHYLEVFKDPFLLSRQTMYFQVLQSVQTDYQIVHALVFETLC